MKIESIHGLLIGCMVGDSMGLPYEGLTPARQKKLFKTINRQRFLSGYGVISDDTEHCLFTAYAVYKSAGDPEPFSKSMESSLKKWFLCLPYGIGWATLKSCIRLLIGFPADRSGVFSAGNGPAMRSALLGVCFGSDFKLLKGLVKCAARITHSDPKAETGALAIAYAAFLACGTEEVSPEEYFQGLQGLLKDVDDPEFFSLTAEILDSLKNGETTREFSERIDAGKGVGRYMYRTVPTVLHCWLRNQSDYQSGVLEIIGCGGDTDTTAAILGSIIGAHVLEKGIPGNWISKVISWPHTGSYLAELSEAVFQALNGQRVPLREPPMFFHALRNLLTWPAVMFHGFRRMFPPY